MAQRDEKFLAEIKPLTVGRVLQTPVEAMGLSEVLCAWMWMDEVEGLCKERKDALRQVLLAAAQAQGAQNERGNSTLQVEGATVVREKRGGQQISGDLLLQLLLRRGYEVVQGFDEVRTWQVNPSKVDDLLQRGFLTDEEVKALYVEPTWALRVKKSPEMQALLEAARVRVLPPSDEE